LAGQIPDSQLRQKEIQMDELGPYGEWAIGLGIRMTMPDGEVKSWSEERRAVGPERAARSGAVTRAEVTTRGDFPTATKVEVLDLSARLIIDHFPDKNPFERS
jgi:hypothetical protein